ncbi:hypothetical protein HMPREF3213_00364 [Heyndrickxia coagulans]|uniref:Uncharacterized protein n=1 Tax=Heyndrickxia coagulans TaxID=1398 RepID=A0A133L178_HEYCO|nr:hypothetical protein HMPREF3213_00364 [Heyndrickxia coagulans]
MTSLVFPKKIPIKGRICENAGCCPFYLLHQVAMAAFFKTFAFKAVRILA